MRVFVVDNGGQWTHREWRVLKYLGVDTKIIPNDAPLETVLEGGLDGLVLSGGAPRVGCADALGNCDQFLRKAPFPIMGICAGHQYMAKVYGGDAAPGGSEFGEAKLQVLPHERPDILAGVPETSTVWESHHDEVSVVPTAFEVLARSERCGVQVMRKRPSEPGPARFGLQFHPEVEHTQYGVTIFENFLKACKGDV